MSGYILIIRNSDNDIGSDVYNVWYRQGRLVNNLGKGKLVVAAIASNQVVVCKAKILADLTPYGSNHRYHIELRKLIDIVMKRVEEFDPIIYSDAEDTSSEEESMVTVVKRKRGRPVDSGQTFQARPTQQHQFQQQVPQQVPQQVQQQVQQPDVLQMQTAAAAMFPVMFEMMQSMMVKREAEQQTRTARHWGFPEVENRSAPGSMNDSLQASDQERESKRYKIHDNSE